MDHDCDLTCQVCGRNVSDELAEAKKRITHLESALDDLSLRLDVEARGAQRDILAILAGKL